MVLAQEEITKESTESRYKLLMKQIADWPDWKIQALCLDESDLKIKNNIMKMKQSQHSVSS